MKKRPDPPISNVALGGVAALFLGTVGILAGLFYSLRPHKIVELPKAEVIAVQSAAAAPKVRVETAQLPRFDSTQSDENAPVIRIALRTEDSAPQAASTPLNVAAGQPVEKEPAAPEGKDAPRLEDALRSTAATAPIMGAPRSAKDSSNEMVPDIKGPSYTAKKALANGGDAYAGMKPSDARPAKKPEPKKLVPPAPIAKLPIKPEPPKVASVKPDAPAMSPADMAKIDFSKSPVYVLKDGRRIRALTVRDDGTTITIKNEVGTTISFKKIDVKEILRG